MATTIGKLSVILGLNSAGYGKGLSRSARQTQGFTASISKSIARVGAYGVALGVGAVAAVGVFTKKQFAAIDSTAKLADVLGLTTDQLVGYQHAASLAGVSNRDLETGVRRLQKNISDAGLGLTTAKRAFDALGLSAADLNRLSPDEQIKAIADALPNLASQADQTRVAQDLFGRSGVKLIKLLEGGSAAIAAQQAEAQALGLTFSRLDASKIEQANDAVSRLGGAITGAFRTIAVAVAPVVTRLATAIVERWKVVRVSFIEGASEIVSRVAGAFTKLVGFLAPLLSAWASTAFAFWQAIVQAFLAGAKVIFAGVLRLAGGWSGLLKVIEFFRDAFVTGMAVIEFAFLNWQKVVEFGTIAAALAVVRFANQVTHFFGSVIPALLSFLADNWKEVLLTVGANTLTFFENLASNVVRLITSIPDLIRGKVDFSDVWQPLSDGFLNVIKELPDLPERQIGQLEQVLAAEAARLGDEAGAGFAEHLESRLSRVNSVGGAVGKLADSIGSLFSGEGFEAAEFSLDQESRTSLDKFSGALDSGGVVKALERGTTAALEVAVGRKDNVEVKRTAEASEETADNTRELLREIVRGAGTDAAIQVISF